MSTDPAKVKRGLSERRALGEGLIKLRTDAEAVPLRPGADRIEGQCARRCALERATAGSDATGVVLSSRQAFTRERAPEGDRRFENRRRSLPMTLTSIASSVMLTK